MITRKNKIRLFFLFCTLQLGLSQMANADDDTRLLMFRTSTNFFGDMGGLSGADSKCSADSKCKSGSCVAVLSDENQRSPQVPDNKHPGQNKQEAHNWILLPNQTYKNINGDTIATTNQYGTFDFPLENAVAPGADGIAVWTGFYKDWTVANNCNGWTDRLNELGQVIKGYGAWVSSKSNTMISKKKLFCGDCGDHSGTNPIYCVETVPTP